MHNHWACSLVSMFSVAVPHVVIQIALDLPIERGMHNVSNILAAGILAIALSGKVNSSG